MKILTIKNLVFVKKQFLRSAILLGVVLAVGTLDSYATDYSYPENIKEADVTDTQQQVLKITGVVVDESGEALIGASVAVKGTTNGVMAGVDGGFTISAKVGDILTFSLIGYEKKEEKVTSGKMRVVLQSASQALTEVVVTGMTQMDKRLFTGATDQLTAAEIRLDGVADMSRALEGRSAGVSVQNVSGTFGAAPKIRVRGATSIYGNSKPLWVVDGIIMDNIVDVGGDALSSGDAITLISSAIAGLNADDIESFQILKDGSATSIYGARAMAGVIVITTKKGKAGSNRISYTGEFTTRLKPSYRDFNIMNSQEQMGIYKEMQEKGWLTFSDVARASNSGVYGKMYELMNTRDTETGRFLLENSPEAQNSYLRTAEMRNTDWFDELFSSAIMQNHSVSISSGTEKSSTYASMSVMHDPGWYKQSDVQRYTGNLNTSYNISPTVSANLLTNAAYRKQKAPGTLGQEVDVVNGQVKRDFDINPYSYALNSSRALDKSVNYTSNYAPFNILNELDNNNMDINLVDLKFQGELRWKILPELQVSTIAALKYKTSSQEHKIRDASNQALAYRAMGDATIQKDNPFLYSDPDNPYALPISVLPQGGIYRRNDFKMLAYDFRAAITWNKVFNNTHITNFYGATEVNSIDRDQSFFNGWGMQYSQGEVPFFVYQYFKKSQEQNTQYYSLNTNRNRNVAFIGNGTYSYEGKYIINGTFRYEGSNRLGKSTSARWLPTWNISGAWNAHEEAFFERLNPVLSHFTLKGSYSLTADNPTGNVTNSLAIITSYNPYRPFANSKESGLYIKDFENSELTYEKKHELNIGASIGFLRNRISLEADWFTRNNFDLIGPVNTQGVGGTIIKLANTADMKSHGVEFTVSSKNIITKDFSWNTDLTFSYNTTEITNLLANTRIIDLVSGMGGAMEGYSDRSLFSFRFGGLDEDGFPTLLDSDGNIIEAADINFQQREDVLKIIKYDGPTAPTYTGGLGNTFFFKNFRLNTFITYSFGNKVRLDPVFRHEYNDLTAMPKEFKNRWTLPGDENVTDVPVILSARQVAENSSLGRLYNAYNYSDARIADGGFVRMKEVSISYDFATSFLPKQIGSMSLKLQATNLFLIYSDSKLNGQDPEFFRSGGVSAPMPKQFTMTLRLGI